MNKNGRKSSRCESGDLSNLRKIVRLSSFQPFDHLVGEAAYAAKLKIYRHTQVVMMISSLICDVLLSM